MQKIIAFFLVLSAMFFSFFYGYDDAKVIEKLEPGLEQTLISSDKVSISFDSKITVSTGTANLKISNHTGKFYRFSGEPDIEVLTDEGWYNVAKTAFVKAGEIKGTVNANETLSVTVKGLNTYNIKKGYTYRLVMAFDDTFGETVYAEAQFTVSK